MIQRGCIPISGGKSRNEVVAAREAGMLAGTRASEPSASWLAYHADEVSAWAKRALIVVHRYHRTLEAVTRPESRNGNIWTSSVLAPPTPHVHDVAVGSQTHEDHCEVWLSSPNFHLRIRISMRMRIYHDTTVQAGC